MRISVSVLSVSLLMGAAVFWPRPQNLDAGPSAESSEANRLEPLVDLLLEIPDPAVQRDVLKGMHQAIKGQRDLPRPAKWPQAAKQLAKSPSREVRQLARSLSLIFGDPQAMRSLRKLISDEKAPLQDRQAAIADLAQVRDKKLLPILRKRITDPQLSDAAIRGLAAYDAPDTPALILKHYDQFTPGQRQSALFTLVSRQSYAQALLKAVEEKQVPTRDLSTYLVRQIAAFENEDLNAKIRKVWGEFRPTSEEKARLVEAIKSKLTEEALTKADPAQGRVVFEKTCAGCHQLFDAGRPVGPNLTGSQRNNVDYILENVLDPSAVVGRDYRLTTIATADGRVLTGVVTEETGESLTLKTPKDDVLLATSEIEARKQSRLSMMPEGQFEKLTDTEIRNLIAYLASPAQVPLPAGTKE